MDRRNFLRSVGVASAAGAVPLTAARAFSSSPALQQSREQQPVSEQFPQQIPADQITNNPGVEYFFTGNGVIACAVQICATPVSGSPMGMLLMQPGHFSRKNSTYLFHPELGLQHTLLTVVTEHTPHKAGYDNTTARYAFTKDFQPSIIVSWTIGSAFEIEEEFIASYRQSAIIRRVRVKNNTPENRRVAVQAAFYPNFMLFDSLRTSPQEAVIEARGFLTTQLYAQQDAEYNQRWITVNLGSFDPMQEKQMEFIYLAGDRKQDIFSTDAQSLIDDERSEWANASRFVCSEDAYNRLFDASCLGIQSVVAKEGEMDAGLWQYNAEWVQDSCASAIACVHAGRFATAYQMLKHIMKDMVADNGSPMEASRFVADDMMELNQSGLLLYALWVYWVWTGKDIYDEYWSKAAAVADHILSPAFLDPASGLIHNKREFWERTEAMGIRDGYELSHQVLCTLGLEKAASYAAANGHTDEAARWAAAAKKMKDSLLHHPVLALVAGGRFIKRRSLSGEVVDTISPPDKNSLPPGVPLAIEDVNYIDPDASDVFPIIFGLVEGGSPPATATLANIEKLWNQRWNTGGYGRYDASSEPDSPGAWTFPSVFIARAYAAAGDGDKVKRVLEWLGNVQGGKGGSWFEFYGSRPVPPLPPVGIVGYAWAEIVALFLRDLAGVRPEEKSLVIRPKLLAGIRSYDCSVRFRGSRFTLSVAAAPSPSASVNGSPLPMENGAAVIPLPMKDDSTIEMRI